MYHIHSAVPVEKGMAARGAVRLDDPSKYEHDARDSKDRDWGAAASADNRTQVALGS